MQNDLSKLVQVCFYGIVILVGAFALGSKMGELGPVLMFASILFLIVLSTQFGSFAASKKGAKKDELLASIRNNKGGFVSLVVIVAATLITVFTAF